MPLPPSWSPFHTTLKRFLIAFVDDIDVIKTMVDEAGLKWARVNKSAVVEVLWHNVVDEARKQFRIEKLIDVAAQRVDDPAQVDDFRKIMNEGDLGGIPWKSDATSEQLEALIDKNRSTLLPISFLDVGRERSRAVARIVTPTELGTGFLLNGNLLVTNNHVISDETTAGQSHAEFNYEQTAAGGDKKPMTFKLIPEKGFKTSKDLDWTVVRVDGDPNAQFGEIPLQPAKVVVEDLVSIIQHAGGGPKQIALAHNMVTYVDDRVVQYLTDTLGGSSGSPVFNKDWQVVAIHRRYVNITDPGSKKPLVRNEGIPIAQLLSGAEELLEE